MTRLRDLTADNVRVRDMIGTAHVGRHPATDTPRPRPCAVCGADAQRAVRLPSRTGVPARVAPVCDACSPYAAARAAGVTRYRGHR